MQMDGEEKPVEFKIKNKPKIERDNFNCPFCNIHSHQVWGDVCEQASTDSSGWHSMPEFRGAICSRCEEVSIWKGNELIYPDSSNMPLPNEDLEADIKLDYNEATSIVEKSPRAAAALLRLAIQKLCKQLWRKRRKP